MAHSGFSALIPLAYNNYNDVYYDNVIQVMTTAQSERSVISWTYDWSTLLMRTRETQRIMALMKISCLDFIVLLNS